MSGIDDVEEVTISQTINQIVISAVEPQIMVSHQAQAVTVETLA